MAAARRRSKKRRCLSKGLNILIIKEEALFVKGPQYFNYKQINNFAACWSFRYELESNKGLPFEARDGEQDSCQLLKCGKLEYRRNGLIIAHVFRVTQITDTRLGCLVEGGQDGAHHQTSDCLDRLSFKTPEQTSPADNTDTSDNRSNKPRKTPFVPPA